MDSLIRDVRYGIRVLLREPVVTLLAVLALTLGIGATTAVFTVVNSVLLRPLPYESPERLVVALHGPTASAPVSPADFLDYRRDARSFERLGAAQAWGATLTGVSGRNGSRGCASRTTCSLCWASLPRLGAPLRRVRISRGAIAWSC